MSYELHPLCTLFPQLSGAEFDALRDDIKENGLRQPIILHEGMILDGGNRYRACIAAGVEPMFTQFGGGNLVSFVLSANLHRRHMSAGQQAAIVASAQDWAKAQSHGGDRVSAHREHLSDTTTTRAAMSGTSVSTQRRADAVAKADPDLAKDVAHGNVSLAVAVNKAAPQLAARKERPAPKPETIKTPDGKVEQKTPAANQDDDDDPLAGETLEGIIGELEQENRRLNEQVAAISKSDLAAQILKEVEIRQGIEARLSQEMTKSASLDRELRYYGTLAFDIRKALGVESNRQIRTAIKDLVDFKKRFA